VGGPSAWCEGNHFKVGCPGPGNEIFLAELSQSLVFLHICLSEVDGPVLTRSPGSSIGNEIFLAELSLSLVFLHICLSEVDGPVLTRSPGSSIYDCYPVVKSRQDHHGSQSE